MTKAGDKGTGGQGATEAMTLKKTLLTFGFLLMAGLLFPLRAQNGCVDSPEDPTAVLALLSAAGVLAASVFRSRRKHN